jgi:hypothetical protein
MSTPTRRPRRLASVLFGVIVSAAALATPVAAAKPVDPGTLNPPPPDFINPTCWSTGQQVVCSFDWEFNVVDAPTGVVCGGDELLETTARHVFGHRYYDADRNLVRRDFAERIDGDLRDPQTGVSVRWSGTDQAFETFSVPGDRSTGTRMNTGAIIHVYLDSGRSYMLAAGRTFENVDTGAFEWMGSHPDFDFCAAIAANS